MSWDGIIFQAPPRVSVQQLPEDFEMPALGTTEEISQKLDSLFPEATHQTGLCLLRGDDFWLELNFGYPPEQKVRNSIGVRCNAGLGAIPVLQKVCDCFSARLFDNQMSDFADLDKATESSMQDFSSWRDRALEARHDHSES